MATANDFRGSRRQVGLVFSEDWRTLYEASKLLGRSTGSIYRLVQRMVADELLVADADPPVRGTMYRLNPDARAALEEAAEGRGVKGELQSGQRLLWVSSGPSRAEALRILSRPAICGAVAWVTRTDHRTGHLIAMNSDADALEVEKVAAALRHAGFKCREGAAEQIESAREMRAHAAALKATEESVP